MAYTTVSGKERQHQMSWMHGMKANQEEDFLERNGMQWFEQEEEGV